MQIKYILSHPTQYQSPFIKYLVILEMMNLSLTTMFDVRSDLTALFGNKNMLKFNPENRGTATEILK